jgi:hypothetical protein
MNLGGNKIRRNVPRKARGAIYTVCFVALVVPFVLALGGMLLQAALCFYNQQRVDYVANEVIDHFDSLSQLNESKFDSLFSDLASANSLRLQNVKSEISPCPDSTEETVQIKVSGSFDNGLGLFAQHRTFVKIYKIKLSKFETLGYLAINGFPYCEGNVARGLSDYLPIYRPSAALPTWQFSQDNAIGSVRKTVCAHSGDQDDQKPANWKQLAEGLVSIY